MWGVLFVIQIFVIQISWTPFLLWYYQKIVLTDGQNSSGQPSGATWRGLRPKSKMKNLKHEKNVENYKFGKWNKYMNLKATTNKQKKSEFNILK